MSIKNKVYILFQFIFSKPYYKTILKKKLITFRERNKIPEDAAIIYHPHAIGDAFNLSLFIREFKSKYNYGSVYLCTKEHITGIKSFIRKLGVYDVISFDKKLYIPLRLGGVVHDHKNKLFVINHVDPHEIMRKGISFLEYFPMLLSLKLTRKQFDTNLKRNFLELNNEFTDGKIQKAILFPYPGTLELIDERYWDEIFLILEENNIQTYTNIINENQKEIKGSKRLELKLDEIIRYADKNTIIIARRNGLNDVFALNNCKQLLIYDNSKKNELETYSIFDLYCRLNRNDSLSELCVEKFYDKKSLENIKLNLIKLIN